MKEVMEKLKGFRKVEDSVYTEFIELCNALINSDGDFIKKEHRLKLVWFYNDKVYYSVFHPRPKEKEDSRLVQPWWTVHFEYQKKYQKEHKK